MAEALHEKYVPILQFARREQFYPMAVDEFIGYCTLRQKGSPVPLAEQGQISPSTLAHAYRHRADVYLQSVPPSLADQDVIARWSTDILNALGAISYKATHWQEELAQMAYRWLSAKTQKATKLFWWNDIVMGLLAQGKRSGHDLPRLNLPPEIQQVAAENYARSQPSRPNYTYYYRITRDRDYLCLQYWFFYGYNDWATSFGGMNDHEGDWEGVYLFFRLDSAGNPQEPPAYLTYVGHHSRLTKPWKHPDVTLDGNHPVAYVAAGSHATYPERKEYDLIKIYNLIDHATGDGLAIKPSDWQRRIDLNTEPWTSTFLGSWGTRYWLPPSWADKVIGDLRKKATEIGLPGVSAPRGPRYADDGTIRPNWIGAVDWAGILDLEK